MTLEPTTRVWRYMSFAKLVWMLQMRQLWFSSAELLDDKWEVMLDTAQLNSIINNRPADLSTEQVIDRTAKTVKDLRKQTFISCWSASEHESHALWRVFCPSSESVAIQTTLGRLKESTGFPIVEVSYGPYEDNGTLPGMLNLVTQKRPMYAYEKEVRIIVITDLSGREDPEYKTIGVGLRWDPESHLENIWVHPEAQSWFIETVKETVRQFAPKLCEDGAPRVCWSAMRSRPPF